MADLKDPALPPGAIVATHEEDESLEEGQVRRNDGVVLNPAVKNPWYVLATVVGEQIDDQIDRDLHTKNRRFWNGWLCQGMSDEERNALSKQMQVSVEELVPLSKKEIDLLEKHFAEAFPDVTADNRLLDPESVVDMSRIHFQSTIVLEKCHFAGPADFKTAHFAGHANFETAHFARAADFQTAHFAGHAFFDTAHFAGDARFHKAHFGRDALFNEAHFARVAAFHTAHFGGEAILNRAHFAGGPSFQTAHFGGDAFFNTAHFAGASFQTAHFAGAAYFRTAHFAKRAFFSDGAFKGKTVFADAMFKASVPEFYQREMHQNTSFSDDPARWPTPGKETAEDGKKAYTRLRQVASEVYDPDLEHFFLRQEMRCKERIEWDKRNYFHWFFFFLYRKIADSGVSVSTPFWLMVCVWSFGVGCAAGYFDSGVEAVATTEIQDNRYWSATGISFGNLFGFLGINRLYFSDVLRVAPDGLQFVAGLQTVLGVVLLFFFGLGLRNRFRLK